MLRKIGPTLRPDAIVTDVGSTKRSVVRLAAEILPEKLRPRFVGSHPMAGSEKRGVEHARADLFRDALCILTPTSGTDSAAVNLVEQFWHIDLAMRTARMSPEDHDRHVAAISHLPHALSAALVAMQNEDVLKLAGSGFRDMSRLAGGDPALWRDIFFDNADNLLDAAELLQVQLERLRNLLSSRDAIAIEEYLRAAAAAGRNRNFPTG
jgi:prephenate dehydrogenase